MIVLEKDNFEEEITKHSGVAMVDFWSESCDLCKELMPDVEKLAEKYGDKMKFAKLDIQGKRRLAMAQGVMGLPSLVFYKDGEKKEHLSGEDLDPAEIEKVIQSYI